MWSQSFGLNSVVVCGKQRLCFPSPSHTLYLPLLCPFFQLSVPCTLLILEVCTTGGVMLIPGHESLWAGFYHLAQRYFMVNEHLVAPPNTWFWIPCLWCNCTMHSYCYSLEATWRLMGASPECQELRLKTSRLANPQSVLSLANKQLSGTAFLCWGS